MMIIVVVGVLFVYGQKQRLQEQQEAAAQADEATEVDLGPLVFGGIVPLTGPMQNKGLEIQKAALLALAEINEDGGITERQVEIIWKDGGCSAGPAITAAQELITIDDVRYILGPVCNAEADAVARISASNKVVTLSPSANLKNLTELGAPYFFRTALSETLPAQAAAEFLVSQQKAQNIALLANDDDGSTLWKDTFVETLRTLQAKVVSNKILPGDSATLDEDAAKQYADELKKLETAPQAILAAVNSSVSVENLMMALADAELSIPVVVPHEYITVLLESSEDEDKEQETEIYENIHTFVPFTDTDSRAYKKFLKLYTDDAGASPTAAGEAANMYSQLFLLQELIEEHGEDPEVIKEKIKEVKNWKHALGTLTITEAGERAGKATIMKVENGALKNIAVHELQ